eukprot:946777_1
MSRLFTRIKMSRIISSLTDEQKQCIKTLLDGGMHDIATNTLKSMVKDQSLIKSDTDAILDVLQQPQMKPPKNAPPQKQLRKKMNRILVMHDKLKGAAAFKYRDDMKRLGTLQFEIGHDINELSLSGLDTCCITGLTRRWATCCIEIEDLNENIQKEDDGLLAFDLSSFITEIDNQYKKKKELIQKSENVSKKKKRTVMKNKNKAKQKEKQTNEYSSHHIASFFSSELKYNNLTCMPYLRLCCVSLARNRRRNAFPGHINCANQDNDPNSDSNSSDHMCPKQTIINNNRITLRFFSLLGPTVISRVSYTNHKRTNLSLFFVSFVNFLYRDINI